MDPNPDLINGESNSSSSFDIVLDTSTTHEGNGPSTTYGDKVQSNVQPSVEILQKKLYALVDELKAMHSTITLSYRNKISYELLSELAHSLLNDTVFDIVESLMEIQHATEEHLKKLRADAQLEAQTELEEWTSKITDQEELEHITKLLMRKQEKNLHEIDKKLVNILDSKVKDQQSTLCKAGVAGFYETDNPVEITIQMLLLDLVLRLSKKRTQINMLSS